MQLVTLEERARRMIFVNISLSIDRERSILITLVVKKFRSGKVKEVREGKVCENAEVW